MPDDKSAEILAAIFREAALVEAEHGTSTAEDRKWAKEFDARLKNRIAEKRRALLPATPTIRRARPVRKAFRAMVRDAMLSRIAAWAERKGGALQLAYRHRAELSDDDLRQILEAIEPPESATPE